ncbi:MAG: hypothetical protein A2Z57_04425 [Planctomycetes bacterium RIFCSPHIGHO2_12_39_6]|nr:MAG: hypothetical protein A2Z57_04425 [Planctomycetes bacterium RIFCSPHIGHO2_12_39_6]
MANDITKLGSGLGFIYITHADGTSLYSNIKNNPSGRDAVLFDAINRVPLAGEKLAQGSVLINVGAGTVTNVTVDAVGIMGGVAATGATPALIATDLANKINTAVSAPDYTAEAINDTVYIYAATGTGSAPNGFVVTSSVTAPTTTTDTDMQGGSPATGVYDTLFGHRYFIDETGVEGTITGTEITNFLIKRGEESSAIVQSVTIVGGTITVARQSKNMIVYVDTEAAAATDNLDTINITDFQDGDTITFRGQNAGRVVTFRDRSISATGNIFTASALSFATGDETKQITTTLVVKGGTITGWREVTRNTGLPTVAVQYTSGIAIAVQGRENLTLVNTGTVDNDIGKTGQAYWIAISGPTALIGNVIYQPDPTPTDAYLDGMEVIYDYRSLAVTGGFTVTLGDILLTDEQATTGNVTVWGKFMTGTWYYFLLGKTNGLNILDKVTAAALYELLLGNPAADGLILSSTAAGVRSWIPNAQQEVLYNITANNGTTAIITEEILKTYTLPGGTVLLDDDILYVRGVYQTAATANGKTMTIYFGATSVATITGAFNAQTIIVEGEINRIDINNQSASFKITEYDTATGAWVSENGFYTLPAENLAADVDIKFAATNGVASLGDILSRQASVKIFGKRN